MEEKDIIDDLQELYEERAAIGEFDGELPRNEAQDRAIIMVLRYALGKGESFLQAEKHMIYNET